MTAQELLQRLNLLDENERIEAKSASHSLKKLRDAGLFQQNGKGSATWYQPTALMMGQEGGLSSNPGGLSSNPESLSSNPEPLSSKLDATHEEARRALLNELLGEMAARIGSLGKRSTPDEMRDVVVDLCRERDYRAEELSLLLGRNVETVRQNYLRPLLRDGRITMTRPDKPNDPQQAYRAVEQEKS